MSKTSHCLLIRQDLQNYNFFISDSILPDTLKMLCNPTLILLISEKYHLSTQATEANYNHVIWNPTENVDPRKR